MLTDLAALHQIASLMEETETIKALGEYWYKKIYKSKKYSDGRPIDP